MNSEIALKILEILVVLDDRILQVENCLENLRVEDHYFSGWGSNSDMIEEIRVTVLTLQNEGEIS